MLTWDQIKEMAKNRISFGAHTVNHPILTRISLDMVEKEVRESKERIETQICQPATTLAYPFGKKSHYSPSFFPILKKLGLTCAVTTEKYTNRHDTGLFELNRAEPWEFALLKGINIPAQRTEFLMPK